MANTVRNIDRIPLEDPLPRTKTDNKENTMSDTTSDFDTLQTTDAAKWAEGFMQTAWPRLAELDESEIESVMIGWFANAIETTRILDAKASTDDYGRHGNLVAVGSAAFEEECQKRNASVQRILDEQDTP